MQRCAGQVSRTPKTFPDACGHLSLSFVMHIGVASRLGASCVLRRDISTGLNVPPARPKLLVQQIVPGARSSQRTHRTLQGHVPAKVLNRPMQWRITARPPRLTLDGSARRRAMCHAERNPGEGKGLTCLNHHLKDKLVLDT